MKLRTLVNAISAVILGVTLPALSAQAAMVTTKGQVQYIRTHDATQFPNWAAPKFWFTLKGVSVAGRCQTWQGAVLFVGEDKQELAVVLTAQVSGQEIEVSTAEPAADQFTVRLNGGDRAVSVKAAAGLFVRPAA